MKNRGYNWSYLFEDSAVDGFLKDDRLWGQAQDASNPGRQAWLRHVTNTPKPVIVGELGPGIGTDYKLVSDNADMSGVTYHALDVTPEFCTHLAKTYPNLKVTLVDGYNLPFTSQYFDLFYMRHVLEHQENYRWQLREVFRVTSKEIFITFFLPLTGEPVDEISFDNVFYHNKYSFSLFEKFCNKYKWGVAESTNYVSKVGDVDYTDQVVILRRI